MRIFRIVITGEEPPHYTISNAFHNKFESVDTLYWDEIQDIPYLNDVICARVKAHQYDVVFLQVQKAGVISIRTFETMAKSVPVVFNWTGDVRTDIDWYKDVSAYVVTLFTNMTDVRAIRKFGQRADYLQTGYDHKYYFNQHKSRINNIAFCGNYYPEMQFPLTELRAKTAYLLKVHYPENFNLYGRKWEKIHLKSEGFADNQKEAELYNATSLALSISHFNYSRYFSDRLLREMACGCCVLSHRFQDCDLEFTDGEHIVFWDNETDLLKKIDFYLKNPSQARIIGDKASKYVAENYSWDKVVENLITLINKWRSTYQN